jgi:hypothetical protein
VIQLAGDFPPERQAISGCRPKRHPPLVVTGPFRIAEEMQYQGDHGTGSRTPLRSSAIPQSLTIWHQFTSALIVDAVRTIKTAGNRARNRQVWSQCQRRLKIPQIAGRKFLSPG